jgi:PAS domain S-box-containing protein
MKDARKTKARLIAELESARRQLAAAALAETERKRAEEALRQSEEIFRRLTERAIVGVYLIQDDTFRYVNPKMAEILGYEVEDLVDHRGPKDVVFEEDWPTVSDNLRKRIAGEMESINYGFRGVKSTGEVIHIEVYGSRTEYKGRPAVIGAILDVTHRAEAKRQLQRAQEDERKRLALELHDGIGQSLSAVKFRMETLVRQSGAHFQPKDRESLEMLVSMIQGAIREVRQIAMDLRPSLLDDIGLLAALSWFLREFQNTYAEIAVTKKIAVEERDIAEPLKIVVFRVVQEALNNTAKHSGARLVEVRLEKAGKRIELAIRDNGTGFEGETDEGPQRRRAGGLGLAGMRERTELAGGLFALETAPGRGTTVRSAARPSLSMVWSSAITIRVRVFMDIPAISGFPPDSIRSQILPKLYGALQGTRLARHFSSTVTY